MGKARRRPTPNRLSPEQRQRFSDSMKQKHAEGKMKRTGPMPVKPKGAVSAPARVRQRASRRVAEAAQADENARRIIEVFRDAIHPNQPMGIRLKGAELWLGVEREEAKVALAEADSSATKRSREELIQILSEKLTAGPAGEILQKQLEEAHSTPSPFPEKDFVEADVVEDEDDDEDEEEGGFDFP